MSPKADYRPLSEKDLADFLRIYEISFPVDERRLYNGTEGLKQFILSRQGKFNILGAYSGDTLIGFITYWKFPDYHYIEHFAIDPSMRGANIGGEMLDGFIADHSDRILIEVEHPTDDLTRRRIAFYERHGFRTRPETEYIQPPYGPDQEGMPLLLMTHGDAPADPCHLLREVYVG